MPLWQGSLVGETSVLFLDAPHCGKAINEQRSAMALS